MILAEEVDDLPCVRCGHKRGHHRAEYERSDREHPEFEFLTDTLELAVPFEIANLQRQHWGVVERIAHDAANVVAARADLMMFGGEKGAPGRVFAALARGIAACSFAPAGVSFRGYHWCAKHPDSPSTEGQYDPERRWCVVCGRVVREGARPLKCPKHRDTDASGRAA